MNKGGRPTIGEVKMARVTVYLTPAQILAAHTAGNGNVSDGLRHQLQDLENFVTWHRTHFSATQRELDPLPRSRHQ